MAPLSRRTFIKSTAALAAASTFGCAAQSRSRIAKSNSDVRVAMVGFKGRGASHLSALKKIDGVRITALCDVDTEVLDKESLNYSAAAKYTDLRKLLDSKDVDAISIATPNHWHALQAIWAIQAGKDVYVEKPVSHNVSEGRRIVEFARKYNRIVQAGTQSRSSLTGIAAAVTYVRAGKLGKIKVARGICYKRRASIGKVDGPQQPPATVDFDLWTGPAKLEPLMRKKLHYDWHWVWNTGNGDLGNQGIHQMDIARWFLGVNELSPQILTAGGRVGYTDDGETPNTLIAWHDYPEAPLIFEVRGLPAKPTAPGATTKPVKDKNGKIKAPTEPMDEYKGSSITTVIECEHGYVEVPFDHGPAATAWDNDGNKLTEFKGAEDHHANWIKAVRSRKIQDLNSDILEGHLSSALCHTSNLSHRLGKASDPEQIRSAIREDRGFSEAFDRMMTHLAVNHVDVSKSGLVLGAPLRMDPATERFVDNDAANVMLTRDYRAPFIVPKTVV